MVNKINPKFLEMAKRQMSDKPPLVEIPKPENKTSESGLIQILERDKNGKPQLNLTPMKETAVNTQTQEQYDILMQVYECGGWKWEAGNNQPTKSNYFNEYGRGNCMEGGISYISGKFEKFGFTNNEFYREKGWDVISTQEFYKKQNVSREMLDEINRWFDKNE